MIYGAGRLLRKDAGTAAGCPPAYVREYSRALSTGAGRLTTKDAGTNHCFPPTSVREYSRALSTRALSALALVRDQGLEELETCRVLLFQGNGAARPIDEAVGTGALGPELSGGMVQNPVAEAEADKAEFFHIYMDLHRIPKVNGLPVLAFQG